MKNLEVKDLIIIIYLNYGPDFEGETKESYTGWYFSTTYLSVSAIWIVGLCLSLSGSMVYGLWLTFFVCLNHQGYDDMIRGNT